MEDDGWRSGFPPSAVLYPDLNEFQINLLRYDLVPMRFIQQPAESRFPVFANIQRPLVHIHGNEAIIQILGDPAAELARVF